MTPNKVYAQIRSLHTMNHVPLSELVSGIALIMFEETPEQKKGKTVNQVGAFKDARRAMRNVVMYLQEWEHDYDKR